jgi:hypothetical protein
MLVAAQLVAGRASRYRPGRSRRAAPRTSSAT